MYPSSSRDAAMYPSLWDGLPCHTGIGVDVVVAVSHGVGVSNPAHLSGSCAHVRCWYIQSTTTHQYVQDYSEPVMQHLSS